MADLCTLAELKAYLGITPTWAKATAYSVGDNVRANNAQYSCITAGTSAAAGAGPSGTTSDITDNTVHWKYVAPALANDDALLAQLITAASTQIEAICDRAFATDSYTLDASGNGRRRLMLPESPVTAIASVSVGGVAIQARASVTSTGWVQDGDSIVLDGYTFDRGTLNVSVAYTAGYDTIPVDLDFACVETCASWYRRKARVDEKSKSIQGEVISFSMADFPATAMRVINSYRRVWPRP